MFKFKKKREIKLTEEFIVQLMKKASLNPNTTVELVLKDGTILRMNNHINNNNRDLYL
jgi:hypothetical protein